jgi:hypothetical protein
MAVIEVLLAARRVEELTDSGPLFRRTDLQDPPDLAGQDIVVPLLGPQETVEPGLGQAEPVKRRRIEVAATRLPGFAEDRVGLLVADGAIEIAQGRGAEPELGEGQAAVVDSLPVSGFHCR